MMYNEFLEMSKANISFKAYSEIIEPLYMATDMFKQEFIDSMMPVIESVAMRERHERESKKVKEIGTFYAESNNPAFVDQYQAVGYNEETGEITAYVLNLALGYATDVGFGAYHADRNRIKVISRPHTFEEE